MSATRQRRYPHGSLKQRAAELPAGQPQAISCPMLAFALKRALIYLGRRFSMWQCVSRQPAKGYVIRVHS